MLRTEEVVAVLQTAGDRDGYGAGSFTSHTRKVLAWKRHDSFKEGNGEVGNRLETGPRKKSGVGQ